MLVNRVVVGKPYKRYRNAPSLVKPPEGFDSVSCILFYFSLLTSAIGCRGDWLGPELRGRVDSYNILGPLAHFLIRSRNRVLHK